MIEPKPTTREVIDPSRLCNIRCKVCYYLHKDLESVFPLHEQKSNALKAKKEGNDYIDITGGEPTIYPEIIELLKFIHLQDMKTCIITNGLAREDTTEEILNTGIDDFLVSVHGNEKVHDEFVCREGARKKQIRFMDQISKKMKFRINFVINKFNQDNIFETVTWLVENYPIYIFNAILFNPHHEWRHHPMSREVIPNLFLVESSLNKSIELLEKNYIGVNVRYYPMCRIHEKHRKCVCNDLQVGFDNFEWSYNIQPKDFKTFRNWGINLSSTTEHHKEPCTRCDLQWICGGINKYFNNFSDGKYIESVTNTGIEDKNDFYYYRRHNELTLQSTDILRNYK